MLASSTKDGLLVRPLETSETEVLYQLVAASRGMYWFDWWPTREQNERLIVESLAGISNGSGFWSGIWRGDALAGMIGLSHINRWNASAHLDYWLTPSFQGLGLATGAARMMAAYAFETLDLNRLEIRCASANRKSRRVGERLGFVLEGTVRKAERFNPAIHPIDEFRRAELASSPHDCNIQFFDHVIYGKLRAEWDAELGQSAHS